jgi:hypothetical protein
MIFVSALVALALQLLQALTLIYCFLFWFIYFRQESTAAIQGGIEQLQVLKRQVVLGKVYPSAGSVMDSTDAPSTF